MENKKSIEEIISQMKKLEENNFSSIEYTSSINMLINSNDLARPKDEDLAKKVQKLNNSYEDINKLTAELLKDLVSKNN